MTAQRLKMASRSMTMMTVSSNQSRYSHLLQLRHQYHALLIPFENASAAVAASLVAAAVVDSGRISVASRPLALL